MGSIATRLPGRSTVLTGIQIIRRVRSKLRPPLPIFKMLHRGEEQFECPVCNYQGPFVTFNWFAGVRKHAICPKCESLERHRLQYLALKNVLNDLGDREMRMLHFAPEPFFQEMFSERFEPYETADLFMNGVNHKVDIQNLPFEGGSYDFVFASHVLEHIQDDVKAIREIRRVLRPNGVAVLPVPIVSERTIEYPEANPHEGGHVRAPGLDYFDKYKQFFGRVEVYSSESFPISAVRI